MSSYNVQYYVLQRQFNVISAKTNQTRRRRCVFAADILTLHYTLARIVSNNSLGDYFHVVHNYIYVVYNSIITCKAVDCDNH